MQRYRLPVLVTAVGAMWNIAVIVANGGVMPVIGAPADYAGQGWSPFATYGAATSDHRLLLLADRWSMLGFSPGDLVILLGCVLILATLFRGRQTA